MGYETRLYADLGNGMNLAIRSFECVPLKALEEAADIVESMLRLTPDTIKRKLVSSRVTVGVIGVRQVTSDIPMHAHLKGKSCGDDRTYDEGTRGVGGTTWCPCSSIAEENLLMYDEDIYDAESIMVHELAHTVMNCGFSQQQHLQLEEAYAYCCERPERFDSRQYFMCNTEEFWAELTQAWFHASIRKDVNGSINTRAGLKEAIPKAAALMAHVYGDGSWLYSQNCPKPQKW